MNGEPKRENAAGEKDSWEGLAEDLFGINFSKTRSAAKVGTDEPEQAAEPAPIDAVDDGPRSVPAPADSPIETADQASVESHDDLIQAAESDDASDDSDVADIVQDKSTSDSDREDTYWDALESWQWDQTSSKSNGAADSSGQSELVGAEARTEPTTAPTTEKTTTSSDRRDAEAYVTDDDFGFGIFEEESPREAAQAEFVEAATEEPTFETDEDDVSDEAAEPIEEEALPAETEAVSETDVDEPEPSVRKRRRRRRRRRGRSPKTDEVLDESPSEAEPAAETGGIAADDDQEEVAETDTEVVATVYEKPPERKRRRRRSSRRRRKDEPTSDSGEDAATEDSQAESDDDDFTDEQADGDSDRSVTTAYRDLPTWEEAISYVLNPDQIATKTAEPETVKGDASRSDSTKSPKSSGRRGRRRR